MELTHNVTGRAIEATPAQARVLAKSGWAPPTDQPSNATNSPDIPPLRVTADITPYTPIAFRPIQSD